MIFFCKWCIACRGFRAVQEHLRVFFKIQVYDYPLSKHHTYVLCFTRKWSQDNEYIMIIHMTTLFMDKCSMLFLLDKTCPTRAWRASYHVHEFLLFLMTVIIWSAMYKVHSDPWFITMMRTTSIKISKKTYQDSEQCLLILNNLVYNQYKQINNEKKNSVVTKNENKTFLCIIDREADILKPLHYHYELSSVVVTKSSLVGQHFTV